MKATRDQIAADIRRLFATLSPYGIRRPSQLAAILRDAKGDDPAFPSDAYIRLMLSEKGSEPSERFCTRFYVLSDYIYNEMGRGGDLVAVVSDAVGKPDAYDPAARLRFVSIPDNVDLHPALFRVENDRPALLAVVPADMLGHCEYDACGRPFYKRVPWQHHCCGLCARRHSSQRRHTRSEPLREAV